MNSNRSKKKKKKKSPNDYTNTNVCTADSASSRLVPNHTQKCSSQLCYFLQYSTNTFLGIWFAIVAAQATPSPLMFSLLILIYTRLSDVYLPQSNVVTMPEP